MATIAENESDAENVKGVMFLEAKNSVELADSKTCTVKLEQGNIELFGIELGTDTTYTLEGPCSLALFSWYGAQVTVKRRC